MAEWTHPRRAAKETISYLSQVEPAIDKFAQDDHSYGGDDEEDEDIGREQMMDNILEELKHQTASIMEDRQGSVVAEKIARRLTPLQLRVMLSRCRGYMLSLANNRYSSHVLQTLLSVAGQVIEAELSDDGAEFREDPSAAEDTQQVDLAQDVVLSLLSELSGVWAEILADISGSHVGRGFLQVLGGLPILTEKRGRQSRHAHSIGTAVGPGMGGRGSASTDTDPAAEKTANPPVPAVDPEALEKWSTPYKHRVPESFATALGAVTSELASLPAGELQALACGTFGCPPLVMLLRVHGNLRVDPTSGRMPRLEQESEAMGIVRRALEWEDEERSAQVVYAISGESTASHFLEAVLWLSPREFFEELYHRCFESKLLEFCEHGVSNFLIQAALQRVDDKALAETMVASIGDNASDLLRARRAGVLWRAAQACIRLGLKPKAQTKLLEDIAGAVQAGHTGVAASPPTGSGENGHAEAKDAISGDGGVSSPPLDAFTAARAWVPALLSPRLPGEGGLDRLFLNVPGARIVQNALLFDPPVAAPVLKAVAALPEAVLAAIARDNVGSRCLLDPILEAAGANKGGGGKGKKSKPAEDARRSIMRAFRGHLVAMACDRVAWHVLLKCFRGVDMKEKRAIAEELAGEGERAWSRMSGYPSGRSVLTECMVERFSRSPNEWEDAFKNRDNRAKMLTEILAVESSTKPGKGGKGRGKTEAAGVTAADSRRAVVLAPSPFNIEPGGSGGGDGDAEDGGKGKEKRRRQRGRGKRGKSSTGGATETGEGGEEGGADESSALPEPGLQATEEGGNARGARGGHSGPSVVGGTRKHVATTASVVNAVDDEAKPPRKRAKKETGEAEGEANPAPKKSKRKKHQGETLGGARDGGGRGTSGDDAGADPSDATEKSAPVGGQAVATGKKDKKKKKGLSAAADGHDGAERGGDAASGEPAAVGVVTSPPANGCAGDETVTASTAEPKKKKKKKNKQEKERMHGASLEGGREDTGSLGRGEAGGGEEAAGGGVTAAVEPRVAASSEKKRKKSGSSSSSGFRLF